MSTSREARKQAIENYRLRKPRSGVYAVRCVPSGRSWVGAAPDLDAARNATWFTLRVGSHREASLQAEWRTHGEEHFRFDILEEIDADTPPLLVRDVLKERKAQWAEREHAPALLP